LTELEESTHDEETASDSPEEAHSEVEDQDDGNDGADTVNRMSDPPFHSPAGLSTLPTTVDPRQVLLQPLALTPSPEREAQPSSPDWGSDTSSVHYVRGSYGTAHELSRSRRGLVAKRTLLSLRQQHRYGMLYTCQSTF